MEIKNVTIGYLRGFEKTGIVEKGRTVYKIYRENICTKLCIIDDDYAIDVNNFDNKYEIIKRDSNYRIINDIDSNKKYALDIEPIEEELDFKPLIKQYKKCKMNKKVK